MGGEVLLAEPVRRDQRVDLGGGQDGVAEELLDHADVGAALQEVGGERVAERVRGDPPLEPGPPGAAAQDARRALPGQAAAALVEEQRRPRPRAGQARAGAPSGTGQGGHA